MKINQQQCERNLKRKMISSHLNIRAIHKPAGCLRKPSGRSENRLSERESKPNQKPAARLEFC